MLLTILRMECQCFSVPKVVSTANIEKRGAAVAVRDGGPLVSWLDRELGADLHNTAGGGADSSDTRNAARYSSMQVNPPISWLCLQCCSLHAVLYFTVLYMTCAR